MVTSHFYVESRYAKDKKAKEVLKIILDNPFWNDCHVIVHIVSPMIHLLHIVDSDAKPTMRYVYNGMNRAIDGIKKKKKKNSRTRRDYGSLMLILSRIIVILNSIE